MAAWGVWLVRCVAAFSLAAFGLIFAAAGMFGGGRNWVAVGMGVVMLVAAVLSWPRRPNAWRYDPPTERQIGYATSLGIDIPPGVTKGELSDMISRVTGR